MQQQHKQKSSFDCFQRQRGWWLVLNGCEGARGLVRLTSNLPRIHLRMFHCLIRGLPQKQAFFQLRPGVSCSVLAARLKLKAHCPGVLNLWFLAFCGGFILFHYICCDCTAECWKCSSDDLTEHLLSKRFQTEHTLFKCPVNISYGSSTNT